MGGRSDVSGIEIIACGWANSYFNNAKNELSQDSDNIKGDFIQNVALHATLQQREKHHIEFIECLRVLTSELHARGKEVCLELDLLTQGVEGIKAEIQALQLSIDGVAESIDFASNKPVIHWMESEEAATDKAKEIGLNILPEWSMADLRYKLDLAINGHNEAQGFTPLSDIEISLIKTALTKHYLDNLNEQPSESEHNLAMARIEYIARGR